MRYYSTQRPVMHGAFPKPQGNKVLAIEDFGEPTFCAEIKRHHMNLSREVKTDDDCSEAL